MPLRAVVGISPAPSSPGRAKSAVLALAAATWAFQPPMAALAASRTGADQCLFSARSCVITVWPACGRQALTKIYNYFFLKKI
jgi:hypothetical protein